MPAFVAVRPYWWTACRPGPPPLRSDLNLGSDVGFVLHELLRLDVSVVIQVELREEPIRVGLHLIERKKAVVVAVGLAKPFAERVLTDRSSAERLTHRTDERGSAMA